MLQNYPTEVIAAALRGCNLSFLTRILDQHPGVQSQCGTSIVDMANDIAKGIDSGFIPFAKVASNQNFILSLTDESIKQWTPQAQEAFDKAKISIYKIEANVRKAEKSERN